MTSFVYKLNDGDECVYVGVTDDIQRRFIDHKKSGKIFDSVSFEFYELREDAEMEEVKIIKDKNPKYNKMHCSGVNHPSPSRFGFDLSQIKVQLCLGEGLNKMVKDRLEIDGDYIPLTMLHEVKRIIR